MKFCEKCGYELPNETVFCSECGSKVENGYDVKKEKVKKKFGGKKKFLIIGAAALSLILVVSAVVFVLFSHRALNLSDIERTGVVGAIFKYGCPSDIRTDESGQIYLCYEFPEKVSFLAHTPWSFIVYPYKGEVVFFYDVEDGPQMYRTILAHCEFEENLLNCYHVSSYRNDLEITTNDYDGSYIRIVILD